MNKVPLILSNLHKFPVVAIDTETTGLYWYKDKAFGISVAGYDPQVETMMSGYWDIRDQPRIIKALGTELNKCKMICGHNVKFDAMMLMSLGVDVPLDKLECTSVRAALIDEWELSFSLDALAKKYLGVGKNEEIYTELAKLFGGAPTRAIQIKNLPRAPVSLVSSYAIPDAELAALLWVYQEQEIEKQELQQVWDLERRLLPVLVRMERQGVRVDVERATTSAVAIDKLVAVAQKELDKGAGRTVNVNSTKQMREMLNPEKGEDGRWRVGGVLLESTGTGAPSLDADALRSLTAVGNPHAANALRIRKLIKGKSFLKDHILGHEVNGVVYPNYNQTRGENGMGTGTGRFSIDDPALQQIPARDVEVAEIARSCFIPDYGHEWACFDFKQFEQRLFAHYAKDESVYEIYRKNPDADFYQVMADLSGLPRNPTYAGQANAKQMTLAAIFGMGQGRLAMEMGLGYTVEKGRNGKEWLKPGQEATEALNKFYTAVPGIRGHLDLASSIAKSRGYIKTVLGRRLRFPDGQFTHKAGGLVLQGSAADSLKLKMIQMDKLIKGTGIKMLLSVHDEIDMDVPPEAKGLVADMVKMYSTFDGVEAPLFRVPIMCSAVLAENWFEASR